MRTKCVVLAALLGAAGTAYAAEYKLKAGPGTIVWGYYSAASKPVLRVSSGDVVEIQTVSGNPARLEEAGLAPGKIEPELRAIYKEVTDKGPGGHLLTGPVAIEGAEPGDVLEVRIRAIRLAVPYAYNGFRPGAGFLTGDYPYSRMKIISLDRERNVAHFAPGIEVPLHPFFGSMGVAPPPAAGRIDSAPPGTHAGNMDNRELVAGATLYIPVHAPGALFQVGDGHAGQGNGELDITAMETSLVGTFQFVLRKDMHLTWPRAETPTHYIVMGFDKDLTEAAHIAAREMIAFLVEHNHLSRDDAYMLASIAADFSVTQLVDGNKGVHGMIAKSIVGK